VRAKIIDIYGKRVTIEFLDELPELLKDVIYDCLLKVWKKKRSIDANGYCWKLCSLIAAEVGSSKDEVYVSMIHKYGFIERDAETFTVKAEVDMNKFRPEHYYYKYYQTSPDGKWKSYLVIKGSSLYDTKEMSHFLDMIISEAKNLGIETMTPEQIERMKSEWEKWQGIKEREEKENSQKSSMKTA
jgi:hypothetical protein